MTTDTFTLDTLYLDLDGVLADFDRGVEDLTGKPPHKLPPGKLWSKVARHGNFFAELEFMEDALDLWNHCAHHAPTILTGLPRGQWAEPQKRDWVARKLGEEIEVITCLTKEKPKWSGPGCVLVDDRKHSQEAWEAKGGTFILHRSAAQSIEALIALGILGPVER